MVDTYFLNTTLICITLKKGTGGKNGFIFHNETHWSNLKLLSKLHMPRLYRNEEI